MLCGICEILLLTLSRQPAYGVTIGVTVTHVWPATLTRIPWPHKWPVYIILPLVSSEDIKACLEGCFAQARFGFGIYARPPSRQVRLQSWSGSSYGPTPAISECFDRHFMTSYCHKKAQLLPESVLKCSAIRGSRVTPAYVYWQPHNWRTPAIHDRHSKKKKYFQAPFLVLQLVTNMELVSVPVFHLTKDSANPICDSS